MWKTKVLSATASTVGGQMGNKTEYLINELQNIWCYFLYLLKICTVEYMIIWLCKLVTFFKPGCIKLHFHF